MSNNKPATALPFYCKGRTVYSLNDEDVNVFSACVQDCHTEESELQEIAAYIAHACNAYPELVEALKTLYAASPDYMRGSFAEKASEQARALLAKLGEAE